MKWREEYFEYRDREESTGDSSSGMCLGFGLGGLCDFRIVKKGVGISGVHMSWRVNGTSSHYVTTVNV